MKDKKCSRCHNTYDETAFRVTQGTWDWPMQYRVTDICKGCRVFADIDAKIDKVLEGTATTSAGSTRETSSYTADVKLPKRWRTDRPKVRWLLCFLVASNIVAVPAILLAGWEPDGSPAAVARYGMERVCLIKTAQIASAIDSRFLTPEMVDRAYLFCLNSKEAE